MNRGLAMDMLKLLTRSTSLQKFQVARKGPCQNVPSAGNIPTPRIHESSDDIEIFYTNAKRRGTKRKRSTCARNKDGDLAQELDFFGHESNDAQPAFTAAKIDGTVLNGSDQAKASVQHTDAASTPLSQEECRQILEKHKLKITILRGTSKLPVEKHTDGSSKSTTMKSKKNARLQLAPQPLLSFKHVRARYGNLQKAG